MTARARRVLSRLLVAPIASRGTRIVWAEEDGDRQRVIVLDTSSGARWLAADMPRCIGTRCYRVDFVTLADDGVVFTRGAIGPQPSYVVRRGFRDAAAVSRTLPGDPQPDLAPASTGALYYWYGHGWYRWDFGRARPVPTRFSGLQQAGVLGLERGRYFVRDGACRATLSAVDSGRRRTVIATSRGVVLGERLPRDGCAELVGFDVDGSKVLSAWAFHRPSADPHEELGVVGVVQSLRLAPGATRRRQAGSRGSFVATTLRPRRS